MQRTKGLGIESTLDPLLPSFVKFLLLATSGRSTLRALSFYRSLHKMFSFCIIGYIPCLCLFSPLLQARGGFCARESISTPVSVIIGQEGVIHPTPCKLKDFTSCQGFTPALLCPVWLTSGGRTTLGSSLPLVPFLLRLLRRLSMPGYHGYLGSLCLGFGFFA